MWFIRAIKISTLFHCRILFYTTQPAHVIMIAAVLFVTSVLVPTKERIQVPSDYPHSRTASFIYLASFVIHFGAQIWMTFVSGNWETIAFVLNTNFQTDFFYNIWSIRRSVLILCIAATHVRRSTTCPIPEILHDQRMLESHYAPHIRQAPSDAHVGHRNRNSGL